MQHTDAIFMAVVAAAVLLILLCCVIAMTRTHRDVMRRVLAAYFLIVLAWMAAGAALGATIVYVGGTPLGGKVEQGHYYVGMHNRYTEVSPWFFDRLAGAMRLEERIGLGVSAPAAVVMPFVYLRRAWKAVREDREQGTPV
jgi:hypothetical protein